MCPPPAHHNLFDRRPALQAGLAFAAINAVLDLEKALFAVRVYII
jgi:hypothetical protein